MSIQRVGSDQWRDLFGSGQGCFYCAGAFSEGEDVIHWSGSTAPASYPDLGGSNTPEMMSVLDYLGKHGGVAPGMNVFLHATCVPAFCSRLLRDLERLVDGEVPKTKKLLG